MNTIKITKALIISTVGLLTLLLFACRADLKPEIHAPEVSSIELWPKLRPFFLTNEHLEQSIATILRQMTLEQKVGQMIQGEIRSTSPEDVKTYHLGSVLNGGGAFPGNNKYASLADWLSLADAYYDASMAQDSERTPIPILWGTDAVHGHNNVIGATLFPHNIGLGAAHNPDLMRSIGEVTAKEVAATGINWTFAPTLAVVQDIRWGRTYESFAQTPELVSEYAGAIVEGLQGRRDGFLSDVNVLATAKHYLADGGTQYGDDQGDALLDEKNLASVHAQGFYSAIEAGVQTVMVSYSSVNGKRMHANKYLITDVLKNRLGFDGFVISDWNAVGQIPGCTNDNCPEAINAGIDMLMVPERNDWKNMIANIVAQVNSGEIPMARIDDAVTRILRVKKRAHLFSRGRPSERLLAEEKSTFGSATHREIARQAVRESLVLLKNNNNILPLNPRLSYVVGGSGADSIANQNGGWTISWQGTGNDNKDFPGATSVYAGIRNAVSHAGGGARLDNDFETLNSSDIAIVVLADEPYAEYLGDVQNLDTLEFQQDVKTDLTLLKKLKKENIPSIIIMLTGRPQFITAELNLADALLVAWLPGSEGDGISDVIFKKSNDEINYDFSGKLSFQWPANPCQAIYQKIHASYSESRPAPLFDIGYGLNYTTKKQVSTLPDYQSEAGYSCIDSDKQGSQIANDQNNLEIDGKNWRLQVSDPAGKIYSARSIMTGEETIRGLSIVDHKTHKELHWDGSENMKFSMANDNLQNFTRRLANNEYVEFEVQRASSVEKPVFLSVDCQLPCKGEVAIADSLKEIPARQWQTLSINLSCFADKGADLRKVSNVFSLRSEGELNLHIKDIRVVEKEKMSGNLIQCN